MARVLGLVVAWAVLVLGEETPGSADGADASLVPPVVASEDPTMGQLPHYLFQPISTEDRRLDYPSYDDIDYQSLYQSLSFDFKRSLDGLSEDELAAAWDRFFVEETLSRTAFHEQIRALRCGEKDSDCKSPPAQNALPPSLGP